jgi:pimeloyl-ACP methyl ester carboxylesterase
MVLLLTILLLFALGALYESLARRNDLQKYPPPGQLIDVGGFRLHLHCRGEGSPTVLLDAGLGDSSVVWTAVQEQLAQSYRVCSYDRAGIAWSDEGPLPRTAQAAIEELQTLLANAGESPPYLLVGHSAGANYMRLFANAYPEAVAGLVLVEPPILQEVTPAFVTVLVMLRRAIGVLARLGVVRLLGKAGWMGILFGGTAPPPEVSDRAGFLYRAQSIKASIDETLALPETIREVNRAATPNAWGGWPVRIIAAYAGSAPKDILVQPLDRLVQLSSRGRLITVQGSHFVHFENPEVVVEAVKEITQVKP